MFAAEQMTHLLSILLPLSFPGSKAGKCLSTNFAWGASREDLPRFRREQKLPTSNFDKSSLKSFKLFPGCMK